MVTKDDVLIVSITMVIMISIGLILSMSSGWYVGAFIGAVAIRVWNHWRDGRKLS